MRAIFAHPWFHPLLLLLWTVIGLGLRLLNLTDKPLWTDEFSTLVFSLGNSFRTVPLNEILTTEQLLQPLQPNPDAGIISVVRHLLNESNHPPLFFVLEHFWLKLFPTVNGWVSVWGARSLAVLFGTVSIPAMFALSWVAFRSRLIGQLTAVLMAVSPFGIYLAQEARHYTLPILWVIASLGCLMVAGRSIRTRTPLPIWLCGVWIIVNTLGIATHYFVMLALVAEAAVILTMGLIQSWREQGRWYPSAHWWRIVTVAIGTGMGGLVWLPYLQEVQDNQLTAWIQQGTREGAEWLAPIGQALAGWITMLYLLPIQAPQSSIVLMSGVALILLTLWTVPKLYRGLKITLKQQEARLALLVFGSFTAYAVLSYFGITYLLDRDLTSAFRYNFTYFPAVVVLIGVGLSAAWNGTMAQSPTPNAPLWLKWFYTANRRTVVAIVLFSLIGGLTVIGNLGYQKTHRPDVVVQDIQEQSTGDILVVIAHETHGQTGRLMSIAWGLQNSDRTTQADFSSSTTLNPRFLLAHLNQDSRSIAQVLRKALRELPQPLDLWLVNFREVPDKPIDTLLDRQNCTAITKRKLTDGYRYRLYRCDKENSGSKD